MIIPRYYEDLHMLHENTMPDRSYFIPASTRMDCLVEEREKSDRIQMLNGVWKFKFYSSIYDLKTPFYKEDSEISDYEDVSVPGVWQNYGYDKHQYTNFRYPFPVDPPYVPQDNPCGTYIREFNYVQTLPHQKCSWNLKALIRASMFGLTAVMWDIVRSPMHLANSMFPR